MLMLLRGFSEFLGAKSTAAFAVMEEHISRSLIFLGLYTNHCLDDRLDIYLSSGLHSGNNSSNNWRIAI